MTNRTGQNSTPSAAAEWQRAYRERKKRGAVVVPIEIPADVAGGLYSVGLLNRPSDREDREALASAVLKAAAELIEARRRSRPISVLPVLNRGGPAA